ncbi:hypothetical protein [Paenibacillus bovis]|uniref:Uncharacterized protein n=1 Tax=Paenibacillus bovis TaxID=1616788 RepID=A0A1X9T3X1_9BACL|nr:hypothetical protein [Paenibacillus bovis]ARR10638.1 hypothetical protein AR543_p0030 [Paenibacillus bovis]
MDSTTMVNQLEAAHEMFWQARVHIGGVDMLIEFIDAADWEERWRTFCAKQQPGSTLPNIRQLDPANYVFWASYRTTQHDSTRYEHLITNDPLDVVHIAGTSERMEFLIDLTTCISREADIDLLHMSL